MTAIEKITYGLLIDTDVRHGSRYVSAKAVGRKEGEDHPVNPSAALFAKLELDGLGIYGHVYKSLAIMHLTILAGLRG